jgi:hypothetical protein
MSPAKVARRTVQAIRRGKREVIFSVEGNLGVLGDRLAPGVVSRILAKYGA